MTILEEMEYELAVNEATKLGANISSCTYGNTQCVKYQISLHIENSNKKICADAMESIRKEIQQEYFLNSKKNLEELLLKSERDKVNTIKQN